MSSNAQFRILASVFQLRTCPKYFANLINLAGNLSPRKKALALAWLSVKGLLNYMGEKSGQKVSYSRELKSVLPCPSTAQGSYSRNMSLTAWLRRFGKAHLYPLSVSYTHLRAHETDSYLVCRLLLEKK